MRQVHAGQQKDNMGANTTYYARVPKVFWEWIQVSALDSEAVLDQHPDATEVLHWTQFEKEEHRENERTRISKSI